MCFQISVNQPEAKLVFIYLIGGKKAKDFLKETRDKKYIYKFVQCLRVCPANFKILSQIDFVI